MTNDIIMKLALEANLPPCHLTHPKALARFAKLIAEVEREACANICDVAMEWAEINPAMAIGAANCANVIRARGY